MESSKKYLPIISEFFRYLLVGGSAFLIDIVILYLTKTYVFNSLGTNGILIATAYGFTAGLVFNFILSNIFVFKNIPQSIKEHKIRSFILFTVIGIIGLGLTEVLMYFGIKITGEKPYLLIKMIVAGIVLLWNYIARKIFIFKGVRIEK